MPRDPKAEMQKLLKQSSVKNLDDEQKKTLERLIDIRSMSIDDVYRLSDPRFKDKIVDPYKKDLEKYRKIAKEHLEWLKDKDKELINLLRGPNESWSQVTEKEAISTIDDIRKALVRKNKGGLVAENVANYLYLLTKVQRKTFAKNLDKKLGTTDKNDRNHEVLLALARGTHAYLTRIGDSDGASDLAKKIPKDQKFDEKFKQRLESRSNNATKLFKATNNYVQLQDRKYVFNKNKKARDTFKEEIANFEPDGLLSFALGLKGTEYEDYGQRLALALSVSDSKGNRILATQQASPESPKFESGNSTEDEPLGGIYFSPDEKGGISKDLVNKVFSDWNKATVTPRSHHYVYQQVNSAKELIPKSGHRAIWFQDCCKDKLISKKINADSKGDLGHGNNAINLEEGETPEHSPGDTTDTRRTPNKVLPQSEEQKIPEKQKTPEKEDRKSDGTPNLTNNKGNFHYSFKTKVPGKSSSCNGTFVGKHEIAPNRCEFPIITAKHCVQDVKAGEGGKFGMDFIESISIGNKTYFPKKIERKSPDGDIAIMVIEGDCSDFNDNQINTMYDGGKQNAGRVFGDSGSPFFYNNMIISVLSGAFSGPGDRAFIMAAGLAKNWALKWLVNRYGNVNITKRK